MSKLKLAPIDDNKPTVGKVATDLIIKAPETTNPIEQMREQLNDYEKNFWECLVAGTKQYPNKDLYVVVLTKNEKLLSNVFRNYFFTRLSCPTPDWDQVVYKYKHATNETIFMWVIPSRDACEHLTANALEVVKEEQQLLRYVLAFNDGTLMKLCKDLNNEMPDSPELRDFIFKG